MYQELYNRVNDEDNLEELLNNISNALYVYIVDIEQIFTNLLKEALKKIKPDKSDQIFNFSTGFPKNAPDILHVHLANIIKSFLVHGHASGFLLLATLVPIVKDKLAD